ncbi:MAG: ParB/RepB/Spo0J family partition protein [Mycobacterium leprae]
MSKKGLGRGLGALIPEVELTEAEKDGVSSLEVGLIRPNPKQPRRTFDEGKLEELAASIREHGVVQPIVVRPKGQFFEIVAGERRWRASQLAGLKEVPALVRDFSEAETMEIALIENLQREDLNPLEEAEAYQQLLGEFHLTQDELGKRLGRSRPQITNTLRLLQLGRAAREEVKAGRLSMGHAKVLLGVADADEQDLLARDAVAKGFSVRQLEQFVEHSRSSGQKPAGVAKKMSRDLLDVEQQLREFFGTPVRLSMGEQKGKIEITVYGNEGLQRILDALGVGQSESGAPPKEAFRV